MDSEEFKKVWAEIVNKRMGPAEMWGTIARKIYPDMKIGGGESPYGNGKIAREIEAKRKLLSDIGKGIVSVPDQKKAFLALQNDISRLESVLPERKVGLDGLSPGPCIADETAGFTDEHWAMLDEALLKNRKNHAFAWRLEVKMSDKLFKEMDELMAAMKGHFDKQEDLNKSSLNSIKASPVISMEEKSRAMELFTNIGWSHILLQAALGGIFEQVKSIIGAKNE